MVAPRVSLGPRTDQRMRGESLCDPQIWQSPTHRCVRNDRTKLRAVSTACACHGLMIMAEVECDWYPDIPGSILARPVLNGSGCRYRLSKRAELGSGPMRFSKIEMCILFGVMLGAAALAYTAFQILGFLGIALLGLLIAFVAVQADLHKEFGDAGHYAAGVYARQVMIRQNPSDRVAHQVEMQSLRRPLLIGKLIGGALIAVGAAGFFFLN